MLEFEGISKPELDNALKCVDRTRKAGYRRTSRTRLFYTLILAHSACPLDLAKLSKAKLVNLVLEITSIDEYFNSSTGRFRNGFVPQYKKLESNELTLE